MEVFTQHPEPRRNETPAYDIVKQLASIAELVRDEPGIALKVTRLALTVARLIERQRMKAGCRIERFEEKVAG